MFGYSTSEALGKEVFILTPEDGLKLARKPGHPQQPVNPYGKWKLHE